MTEIREFTISVPDDVIDDLHERLRRTRWPEAELVDDWSQGVRRAYLREVCRYWVDTYDWRSREAELNRLDHYETTIDEFDIHFVHQRSPHPGALPLLLTHGWPGSFVEFRKVFGPLTDPARHGRDGAQAFHVVAPSLPGFGFSSKPTTTGCGVERIAQLWARLMGRLGYDRYVAQGGDWGSAITTALAAHDPDHCAAIHITLASAQRPVGDLDTPEEQYALERMKRFADWDNGYYKEQSTRPQTVGYGLTDSPAAQAAWILEKFWSWTDCDGHPENVIGRDDLLDNITIYWVTETAASSARLYWESGVTRQEVTVTTPTGVAVYPCEIVPPVRKWMEPTWTDIVHWATPPRGGHFAAFEVPDLFVADLREFFARFA